MSEARDATQWLEARGFELDPRSGAWYSPRFTWRSFDLRAGSVWTAFVIDRNGVWQNNSARHPLDAAKALRDRMDRAGDSTAVAMLDEMINYGGSND